jgi:hypothetical protein
VPTLDVDVEAVRREIEEAKQANPKLPRSRAIHDLAEIISADTTVEKLYAFIHVLGTMHAHIREHIGQITIGEVLAYASGPQTVAQPKARHRSGKREVQRGYEALTAFMKEQKEKLTKAEMYKAILANDSSMTGKILEAGWGRAREHFKDEGEYRNKRYWYATKKKSK